MGPSSPIIIPRKPARSYVSTFYLSHQHSCLFENVYVWIERTKKKKGDDTMTIHSYYFVCADHVPSSFVLDVVAKFLVVHVGRRSNVLARRKMTILISTNSNEIVLLSARQETWRADFDEGKSIR